MALRPLRSSFILRKEGQAWNAAVPEHASDAGVNLNPARIGEISLSPRPNPQELAWCTLCPLRAACDL